MSGNQNRMRAGGATSLTISDPSKYYFF